MGVKAEEKKAATVEKEIAETENFSCCAGIYMHVGAVKHCPKCPDKILRSDKVFHRAE